MTGARPRAWWSAVRTPPGQAKPLQRGHPRRGISETCLPDRRCQRSIQPGVSLATLAQPTAMFPRRSVAHSVRFAAINPIKRHPTRFTKCPNRKSSQSLIGPPGQPVTRNGSHKAGSTDEHDFLHHFRAPSLRARILNMADSIQSFHA